MLRGGGEEEGGGWGVERRGVRQRNRREGEGGGWRGETTKGREGKEGERREEVRDGHWHDQRPVIVKFRPCTLELRGRSTRITQNCVDLIYTGSLIFKNETEERIKM